MGFLCIDVEILNISYAFLPTILGEEYKTFISSFMKVCNIEFDANSSDGSLFDTCGRKDGLTDVPTLTGAFRDLGGEGLITEYAGSGGNVSLTCVRKLLGFNPI